MEDSTIILQDHITVGLVLGSVYVLVLIAVSE